MMHDSAWFASDKRPLCVAHRGACKRAPENTLLAFRIATELGADAVELDVRLTSDGVPVIFHDQNMNRLTGKDLSIRSLSLDRVRDLRVGGEPIPTLDEVLQVLPPHVLVNVEPKSPFNAWSGYNRAVARAVAATIHRHRAEKRCLLSSFDIRILFWCSVFAHGIPRAYLYEPGLSHRILKPLFYRGLVQILHPHHSMVDEKLIHRARLIGYRVNVWTVDDVTEMERFMRMGVDSIISNYPEKFLEVRRRGQSHSRSQSA